jgi:hypothetical protein
MNTRKLAKPDALMNQLIFALMQIGMTYKQAMLIRSFRVEKWAYDHASTRGDRCGDLAGFRTSLA